MKSNNSLVSFLQAFGIILVVIGHAYYGDTKDSWTYAWIYSFHMPLFMFISGYLLQYGFENKSITLSSVPLYGSGGFIGKKVKRLLIPYITISTVAFSLKPLFNRFAIRPVEITFTDYLKMLVYPWDNVIIFFWFLPTLFLIFVIVIYGIRIFKEMDKPAYHVGLLIICILLHIFNPLKDISILNLQGVIEYLIYFLLGYYSCRTHLIERLRHPIGGFMLTFLLSVCLVVEVPDFEGKDILTAINGILMSVFLGKIYMSNGWHFLHHLFGASYAIYLFSWFPQVLSLQVFLKLTHAPYWTGGILATVAGIYLPLFVYKLIIRCKQKRLGKVLAFLIGQ